MVKFLNMVLRSIMRMKIYPGFKKLNVEETGYSLIFLGQSCSGTMHDFLNIQMFIFGELYGFH